MQDWKSLGEEDEDDGDDASLAHGNMLKNQHNIWFQHPLRGWIERNIHFKLPACQSLCTCDLCVLMLSFTFFTVLPSLLWSVSPFLLPPLYISVLSQWVNCFIIYLLYINFEGLLLVVSSIFVVFLFSNSTLLHNNTVGLVLCCIKM